MTFDKAILPEVYKMKCRVTLVIAVLSLVITGTGEFASGADYDWMKQKEKPQATQSLTIDQYVLFRAGMFFPDITINGSKLDMENGSGAEAGYGIKPLRWLAAEATFGYIETDDYDDDLNNQHLTVQMVPVTGTVRAIFPFQQFEVYALAGGGMYYTMLQKGNLNQSNQTSDDDRVLFGYHYGGGASLKLGGSSALGIEAKRIETSWNDMDIAGTFVAAFFRLGL